MLGGVRDTARGFAFFAPGALVLLAVRGEAMTVGDPNTLVITKGHPFDKGAFFAMLDAVFESAQLGDYTHVEHPAAQAVLAPEPLAAYDAVLFYDMPGIAFRPGGPAYEAPPEALKAHLAAATQRGIGLVFLHHAVAGWPAWPAYAELIGGRFCYTPQELRGRAVTDSGYRHAVTHEIEVLAPHPITEGVPQRFSMTDELYLFDVFDDRVEPLLRSTHTFTDEHFYSAAQAVCEGRMFSNEGWSHPPASDLVGWTRTEANSRIVYLQGGDDPVAYENEHFRRLIGNALLWVR